MPNTQANDIEKDIENSAKIFFSLQMAKDIKSSAKIYLQMAKGIRNSA